MSVQPFDEIKALRKLKHALERLELRLLKIETIILRRIMNGENPNASSN